MNRLLVALGAGCGRGAAEEPGSGGEQLRGFAAEKPGAPDLKALAVSRSEEAFNIRCGSFPVDGGNLLVEAVDDPSSADDRILRPPWSELIEGGLEMWQVGRYFQFDVPVEVVPI